MPRLLVCHICQTIDELPSISDDLRKELGRTREPEPLLLHAMETRHNHGPTFSGGAAERIALVQVDDLEWMNNDLRDEVLSRFKHEWSGFEPELYAVRSTFHEDALRCFNRHGRPKEGCIDYCDSSKLLTPNSWHTEAEEQIDKSDLTRITNETRAHRKPVFLCHFCPVQTYVTTQRRHQRGDYQEG